VNQEIYNTFKSADFVTVIEACRLDLLGHVVRVDGERTVKKILEGKPGGRRKNGIRRVRWMDGVESDVRRMGVKKRRRALK
jgi:hypothetical protein